jgi:hypothetical protein
MFFKNYLDKYINISYLNQKKSVKNLDSKLFYQFVLESLGNSYFHSPCFFIIWAGLKVNYFL